MTDRQQLEAGIRALEAQRAALGDAVVDAAIAGLRSKLATMQPSVATDAAQTLRHVSILFLDAVGSTALGAHLDPEEISAVMDGLLSRGTMIVQAHRGKVLKYTGDNLLAVFGADEVAEDDAERAVRCGLALLELGKAYGMQVEADYGHTGFDVRVGIHTGEVLLGGGVDEADNIRGQAVNIAARMEQTAPAGGLRLSHDTYAQVRGLFEVERQDPLTVKGIDQPIQSYLVLHARARSFRLASRGIEGVSTRMVGRDAELESLQGAFKRLFVERSLCAITVVADAGIGKSRLLDEFSTWCDARDERFVLFRGRATPQMQGQPYGLLRDIVATHLQIADDDSIATARRKMEQGVAPLFPDEGADLSEAHAHVLGHLIGIDWHDSRHVKGIAGDPKQLRNRAFHVAAQLFRRIGASDRSAVVLQLEDLQWADNESLDFLAYLAEVDRDVSLLMLSCARPTLFERRPGWCAGRDHRRIDLQPLGKDMSRVLVGELLKKLAEVPAALRELVIGAAEGNPFYMEELIRMLIDEGAIEIGEAWTVNAQRLLLTRVPATLTGVLQARLDALPPPERLTLQQASIIGPVFWDRALFALDDRAGDTLPALVRRELALPRAASSQEDLREYAFKHQILHQVTYATVLKRTRRELHGKLARWLAAHTGLRANDFLGAAARHFELADDVPNAAEYHTRAAEYARARMAHEAALGHVQRALALLEKLPEGPARRLLSWRLIETREATLDIEGDRVAQRADIEALTDLANALDDDRRRAHAAWRRSALSQRTADYAAMESAARQAVDWAHRAADDELRLVSQRMVAMSLAFQGRPAEGREVAERTLDEARALGLSRVEGLCLNALGVMLAMQSDDVGALAFDQQALVAHRAAGDRRNEAIAQGNIGAGWLGLGALSRARSDLEAGLRMMRAYGEGALEVSPLCALSTLALWQGDDADALVHARAALETASAVHARDQEVAALCRVGDAELALGRLDAAAAAFTAAQARASEIASPSRYDASAGLARVALARDDTDAAMSALASLLTLDANAIESSLLEGGEFPRLVELTCHRVLARVGDARANAWLARAHAALQARAATIADAGLREGFLRNIPFNREIVTAWANAHPAGDTRPPNEDRAA